MTWVNHYGYGYSLVIAISVIRIPEYWFGETSLLIGILITRNVDGRIECRANERAGVLVDGRLDVFGKARTPV